MQAVPSSRLDDPFYRGAIGRNILIIFGFLVLGLISRLFYLQIVKGSYHQKLSEQNSMRLQIVHAPRGLIYDRNGALIARNRPSYQVAILPTQLKDPKRVLANLMRFQDSSGHAHFRFRPGGMEPAARQMEEVPAPGDPGGRFSGNRGDGGRAPAGSARGHHRDGLPAFLSLRATTPPTSWATWTKSRKRNWRPSPSIRRRPETACRTAKGDRIGRKGLEKTYEPIFRGSDGVRYIKVNAFGKEMEVIKEMPQITPVPGSNLITTLDMGLQVLADSLLGDTRPRARWWPSIRATAKCW